MKKTLYYTLCECNQINEIPDK